MKKQILSTFLALFLAVAGGLVFIVLPSGCSVVGNALEERPVTTRLAVTYATIKVIDHDADRAERVASIASSVRKLAEGDTPTTVLALEELARSKIDWSRLDAADTLLVEILISEIRRELERRLDGNIIPQDSRVTVATVFAWIESAARTAPVVSPIPKT